MNKQATNQLKKVWRPPEPLSLQKELTLSPGYLLSHENTDLLDLLLTERGLIKPKLRLVFSKDGDWTH